VGWAAPTDSERRRNRLVVLAAVLVIAALALVVIKVARRDSTPGGQLGPGRQPGAGPIAGAAGREVEMTKHPMRWPDPTASPTPKPRQGTVLPRPQQPPAGAYINSLAIPAQGVLAPIDIPCWEHNGLLEPASTDPRRTCLWGRGAQLGATQGEATVLGHINYGGTDGVLGRIGLLHKGDLIYTWDAHGQRSAWNVSAIHQRPKAQGVDPDAERGPNGPKALVMVTCGGQWVGGAYGYADLFWVHAVPA